MLTASAATSAFAQTNGTWLGINGSWGVAGTWSGGTIADGTDANANFTGINITANRTITVDADRTIGNITFTDQTTASNSLAIAGTNTLTLDVTTGAPIINVTQSGRSITFSAPLAGNDGLSKIGDGNLILSGSNTYSGNTTFSTVSSTVSGIFRISHNNALGSTSGGTTLFSGGTGGAIGNMIQLSPSGVTVTGETLTLQGDTANTNMSITTGTSASTVAWEGNIIINGLSSVDARIGATNSGADTTLTIGTASTTITGNYTAPISVMGNGINDIQASIQTSGGITRVNSGTLRLAGNNTHTGNTTLGGGTGGGLILANQFAAGNSTLNVTSTGTTANVIQFEGGTAFTLGGLASGVGGTAKNFALTNNASADVALSVGNNNADTTYNGVMSGGGSLIKIGTGNLTLSGNNTFTGNTTVTAGALLVTAGYSSPTTVNSGATLGGNGTMGAAVTLNSGTIGSSGLTLNLFSDLFTTGNSTLAAGSTVNNLSANTTITSGTFTVNGTLQNGIAVGGAGNTLNGNGIVGGTTTVNGGTIGGTLALTTLVATGNSTIAGSVTASSGTTVQSGGVLNVNGTLGGGVLTIDSGATLKGNGIVSFATTVNGELAPGASPGLLTFSDTLTLAGSTTMEINGLIRHNGVTGDYDAVDVTNQLTYGGTLTMSFGASTAAGNSYNLFDFGSQTGSFSSVSVGGLYSASLTNSSGIWSGDDTVNLLTFTFTQSNGVLSVTTYTPIPEPSAYAALAGVGMIGFALYRRRRQQKAVSAA
jgi:autotransporter-associated beta strand protein